MANRRVEGVSYTKMKATPVLSDGLLSIDRDDGGAERRVAAAFARLADQAGVYGDQLAVREAEADIVRQSQANAPGRVTITGGVSPGVTEAPTLAYAGGTARAAKVDDADMTTRAKRIRDGLVRRGLTPMMAAAAVGHGVQESSLRSSGPDGDNGTSSGIWQWRNERRSALQAFASASGKDWQDEDTQLDFFVHELKTRERTAWTHLQSARTLDEATAALMHFERPQGYTIRNPRGGHGWQNRIENATWAAQLGGAPDAVAMAAEPPKSGAAAAIDRQITPASVAPPSVTPISIEPGRAGGFRPTGRNTIYGRAYDAAGTRTYLEQLDATMRQDVDAVYERFKDDPAQLQAGLEALHTAHVDEHVFPEIRADYDSSFARLTSPYLRQARADQEKRVKEQNTADFMMRTQELETGTVRAIERFDGEDAADVLASSQEATDAHYDSAVARGILSAPEAAEAKITSRRNAAVGFYLKQAEAKTNPDDVAAMRRHMSEEFGAGRLDGVDAGAWARIDTQLATVEKAKREGDKVASKALTERGDALADAIFAGGSPMSPEISKFMLDAKTAPDGAAIVKKAMDRVAVAQLLRDKSLGEGETIVRELESKPDAQASGLAGYARKSFDGMRKAVEEDVVGAAEARGLIRTQPDLFTGDDPAAVSGLVRSRVDAAESAAEHFGVRPTYLKPGEAASLKALADSDPDAAARIAGGLVAGAGARAGAVLAELKADAPAITQAGMILAGGGSPRAARDVIAGYGRGADGETRKAIDVKVRDAASHDVFGDAFAGSPLDGEAIEAAAHSIAKVRIEQAGVEPKSPEAREIYDQSLQEAAGAVTVRGVQYGGVADYSYGGWFGAFADHVRVVVPPNMRADRFADVLDAIRDEDLAQPDGERGRVGKFFASPPVDASGKAYRAADLKAARPVAVAGGYRFSLGDPASDDPQWVRAADGRPFVLALDAMRSRLEPRVPGAFR